MSYHPAPYHTITIPSALRPVIPSTPRTNLSHSWKPGPPIPLHPCCPSPHSLFPMPQNRSPQHPVCSEHPKQDAPPTEAGSAHSGLMKAHVAAGGELRSFLAVSLCFSTDGGGRNSDLPSWELIDLLPQISLLTWLPRPTFGGWFT